jgi:hypothetical protein
MAGGGLTTLPVPNDMFEEKSFAPGGIVAFAEGDSVFAPNEREISALLERAKLGDPIAISKLKLIQASQESGGGSLPTSSAPMNLANPTPPPPPPTADMEGAPAIPFENSGSVSQSSRTSVSAPAINVPTAKVDPRTQVPAITGVEDQMKKFEGLLGAPPKPGYLDTQAADLEAQKKQDFWANMLAVGAGMAGSKRGSFLGAVGESLTAANPQILKSIENQRSAKREMQKAEYEYELAKYGVKGKALESAVNQYGKDVEHSDRLAGIASEEARTQATLEAQAKIAKAQMENALRIAESNKDTDAKFIINNNARKYMQDGMSQTDALSQASTDYIASFKQYGSNISAVTDLQVAEAKELAPLESARSKWVEAKLNDKVTETDRQIAEVKAKYKQMRENLSSVPGSASNGTPAASSSKNPTFSWNDASWNMSGPGFR